MATYYATGTASVANGATAVTGSGTAWVTNGVQAGDYFAANGLRVRIASVGGETSITLATAWPGSTLSGNNYEIQFTPVATRVLSQVNTLLASLGNGIVTAFAGVSSAADKLAYFTGSSAMSVIDFKSWARSFISAADVAAGRTSLSVYSKAEADAKYRTLTGSRERITANRTYYVRTDGSDSNTGLSNTAGGAFRTIQYAVNYVTQNVDAGTYSITINVADGTYSESVYINGKMSGQSSFSIIGNQTTPANCVTNSFWCVNGAQVVIKGLRLTSANGVRSDGYGTIVTIDDISFALAYALSANNGGTINGTSADLNIESTVTTMFYAFSTAIINLYNANITVNGNAWTGVGAVYSRLSSNINIQGVTFSGSATGKRYTADTNSVLFTSGGGASFIPGDSAGSTATGGQYI